MLELRFIRENASLVRKDLEKRGGDRLPLLDELLEKDALYRDALVDLEKLRADRNTVSRVVNELKKAGRDASAQLAEASLIPQKIKKTEEQVNVLQERVNFLLKRLPNLLHASVPVGKGEEDNVVVAEWGTRKKDAVSHVDLLEKMGLCDLERASKISGARFYYLKNELVLLDLALQRFALDFLAGKGFALLMPPFMMRREPYEGVTDVTDFEDVMYKVENEDLYLIATSEHPLMAMRSGEVIAADELPLKYAGVSPCFRKEAGSHGKDTKGIFRVHQFNKVEQVILSKPGDSWALHEELLKNSEDLAKMLEIPYQVVNVCTGDIGTVAAKKYDLNAWMPAQKAYRELASCSNCTAYQAVRLNIKSGKYGGAKEYVHSLNSTAIATTRTIVALIENHQEDGVIKMPKALHKYLPFKEIEMKK